MNFKEFLDKVIENGLEAAREDYKSLQDQDRLVGSVAGFNDCRGKTPQELLQLLQQASRQTLEAHGNEAKNYWEIRSREAEIEWVCNVLSSALLSSGLPVIVTPTYRGMTMAAKILNGAGCILVEEEVPYSDPNPAM